jgi:tripartite-type tricarboxylate transporter receptor subunit TctC
MGKLSALWGIGIAVAVSTALAGPASGQDYFSGKKITVTVPAGTGGSYHNYCLLVAQHMGRHIPGNPTLTVANRPGAGGALASAYMYKLAAKDGTDIAMMAPGSITAPLVNKIDYDARKFAWLGSVVARSSAIWVWHTKGVRTLEDLKTKPVKIGSSGFGAGGSVIPRFINEVLGTRMEIVYGYKSGGDINLAIERGEVDGRWNFRSGFVSLTPEWIKHDRIVAIVATGPRDPHHKNIPHLRDILPAGSLQQRVYDLLALDYDVGQGFYAPPETPAKVVAILKTAFERTMKDPDFKADIDRRNLEIEPLTAAQVEDVIRKGFAIVSTEVLGKFRQMTVDESKSKKK